MAQAPPRTRRGSTPARAAVTRDIASWTNAANRSRADRASADVSAVLHVRGYGVEQAEQLIQRVIVAVKEIATLQSSMMRCMAPAES